MLKADVSSYKLPPFSFNIKSIFWHPLLWMDVMLDIICMVFAELWATGIKRNIHNENMCFRNRTSDYLFSSVPL